MTERDFFEADGVPNSIDCHVSHQHGPSVKNDSRSIRNKWILHDLISFPEVQPTLLNNHYSLLLTIEMTCQWFKPMYNFSVVFSSGHDFLTRFRPKPPYQRLTETDWHWAYSGRSRSGFGHSNWIERSRRWKRNMNFTMPASSIQKNIFNEYSVQNW